LDITNPPCSVVSLR